MYTGAFPSASVLMDRSIYVSLMRLRYVFNNVNDVVCVRGRIFDKNIASVFFIIAFGHP